MEKQSKLMALLVWLALFACREEVVPPGLYGYQVEKLLYGDSVKTWIYAQEDQGGFPAITIEKSTPDSIVVSAFFGQDTVFQKTGTASELDLLFTDSLKFSDGTFWMVGEILPDRFLFKTDTNTSLITYFPQFTP